jgi:hypothetical protein
MLRSDSISNSVSGTLLDAKIDLSFNPTARSDLHLPCCLAHELHVHLILFRSDASVA